MSDLRHDFIETAIGLGFDAIGFADAAAPWDAGRRLSEFLAEGFHGDMGWLDTPRRHHPTSLWAEAKSAIVLGLNYAPDAEPPEGGPMSCRGEVSVYARGDDYHTVIKRRLKTLAGRFARQTGAEVKVFVDTAPLMEKPLAMRAGIGWQGKHTNLVSRTHGSWLFLGVILTNFELTVDAPEGDHCGSCQACLDICPTRAFPAPYRIDARRCISYLTIEHKGPIPEEFRQGIGTRIYGCDDCLAVCPWNKFAVRMQEPAFLSRGSFVLAEFLAFDDAAFRARFAGSPVKRIGLERFLRNVLIAAGNSGNRTLLPLIATHLAAESPILREAASWAQARIALS